MISVNQVSTPLALCFATHQLIECSRRKLPNDAWDYLSRRVDSESTPHREHQSFDRGASAAQISQNGIHSLRLPILLVTMKSISRHSDELGAVGAARASDVKLGVSFVVSAFVNSAVKAAPETIHACQFYVNGDGALIEALPDLAPEILESTGCGPKPEIFNSAVLRLAAYNPEIYHINLMRYFSTAHPAKALSGLKKTPNHNSSRPIQQLIKTVQRYNYSATIVCNDKFG